MGWTPGEALLRKQGHRNNPVLSELRIVDETQLVLIVLRALHNHRFKLRPTAKALKIGRSTLYRWLDAYPELRQAVNAAKEERENG